MTPQSRPLIAALWMIGAIFSFSAMAVSGRALATELDSFEMMMYRSFIGLFLSIVFLQMEGGWTLLKTSTPGLHLLRAFMVVLSNMSFFAAIAVLPLAETTALFFAAPLMITLLSIPILGEKVGPMRLSAVLVWTGNEVCQRPVSARSSRWMISSPLE